MTAKKTAKPKERLCKLTMCEDPKTGKVIVKGGKSCPPGYVEKVRQRVIKEGVYFRAEDLQ